MVSVVYLPRIIAMRLTSGSQTRNATHSVESPSMVDPQWNIWYWGFKWNLHTVCWSAVGCEWGTTSVYFGITYVCFFPSILPVFAVEPQYLLQYFLFLSKVSFELHTQNLQKISCWFKIWMGFVGPILIKLWTSSIWGFVSCLCEGLPGIAHANMLVTTRWPLKRAAHLTSLVWVCVLWLPWKLNGAICAMGFFTANLPSDKTSLNDKHSTTWIIDPSQPARSDRCRTWKPSHRIKPFRDKYQMYKNADICFSLVLANI